MFSRARVTEKKGKLSIYQSEASMVNLETLMEITSNDRIFTSLAWAYTKNITWINVLVKNYSFEHFETSTLWKSV